VARVLRIRRKLTERRLQPKLVHQFLIPSAERADSCGAASKFPRSTHSGTCTRRHPGRDADGSTLRSRVQVARCDVGRR